MMKRLMLAGVLSIYVFSGALASEDSETAAAAAATGDNITVGSRVLSASSQYSSSWAAHYLMDGTENLGWSSSQNAPLPQTLVFELAEPSIIESVTLINAIDEPDYPGISVKRLRIEASAEGPEGPWVALGEVELDAQPGKQARELEPGQGRWIRATVLENHGHTEYTELMELSLEGRYVEAERPPVDINGTWQSSWVGPGGLGGALTYLRREGDRVYGTYEHSGGKLSGGFSDRIMTFTWVQNNRRGTVTVARNAEGDAMQGFWWYDGKPAPQGWWRLEKQPETGQVEVVDDYLETEIADRGRVSIYGINFALDSAEILPDSVPTLERIVELMQENPSWRLNIVGHTDSQGSEQYNQSLSERRAAAVVAWLTTQGSLDVSRLVSEGRGESEPMASNAEALGRAANRRVELVRL